MTNFRTLSVTAIAAVALTLASLSACSGSTKPQAKPGSPATASSAGDQEQALKFTKCMRDHGVDMADPQNGQIGTGVNPNGGGSTPGSLDAKGSNTIDLSPNGAGAKAFEACRQYLPNGGQPQKPSAAELAQQVKFAQCMRAHGIDMPDPKSDGSLQGFPVQPGDQAAMQRFEDASRACDTASNQAGK